MAEKRRIYFIDDLRALAIIYMVFFHTLFDLAEMWRYDWAIPIYESQLEVVVLDGLTFVFLSGICANFSKDNARRGAQLLCIALCFTAVTAFIFPGEAIFFGVLHLLAFSMLIYSVISKWINRLPWQLGAVIFALLAAATWNAKKGFFGFEGMSLPVPEIFTLNSSLYPFGFHGSDFASVDYFPLFPWLFVFLTGACIGRIFKKELPGRLYKKICPPLEFIGRHSLFIYVAHQPLIFAVLYIIKPL